MTYAIVLFIITMFINLFEWHSMISVQILSEYDDYGYGNEFEAWLHLELLIFFFFFFTRLQPDIHPKRRIAEKNLFDVAAIIIIIRGWISSFPLVVVSWTNKCLPCQTENKYSK